MIRPLLRTLALLPLTTLLAAAQQAADPPPGHPHGPPPQRISAVDAAALTLTVQMSPDPGDTKTYSLTADTKVMLPGHQQGRLADLKAGEGVFLTLHGTTVLKVRVMPPPPEGGGQDGNGPPPAANPGGGPPGQSPAGGNGEAGGPGAGQPPPPPGGGAPPPPPPGGRHR